ELREAITRPAKTAGVSFEPELVERLMADLERRPSSLPLLQFALREMWTRQQNRIVTVPSYLEIAGLSGALARRAETSVRELAGPGANQQCAEALQRLFTRLVGAGEGHEDMRSIARRREFSDDIWHLAQRLAAEENRLVVIKANEPGHETVELAH